MKISGLQKVSLVDYNEHICATIFTSGCNFACPFCHNSGLVKGTEPIIPTDEVLEYLNKRKKVLDSVCISGGEPTLQHDLVDFIAQIKSMGYLVKLDTNGSNLTMLKQLVENKLIDYIAMDIKNGYSNYINTINAPLQFQIKDSIDYIMHCGIDYEFRTTLISEFHSPNDIIEISKMISGAKRYYLQKFVDNDNCLTHNLNEVPHPQAQQYMNILKKNIPNTQLRGY